MSPIAPTVSVLLPVRNGERFLESCLQSLAKQRFENFEIVAIDDGSVDETGGILAKWQRHEPRLRVITSNPIGLIAALNLGLEHCGADLVARMDADDTVHPDRLLHQVALFEEEEDLAVVACQVEHFSDDDVGEGLRVYERWLNSLVSHDDMQRERFIESPVPHPAVMYRREVVAVAGGYRDLDWPEDYDLWLRLFEGGHLFGKVPAVLHSWRDRPDRLTRTHPRYAVERFLECKAEHLLLGPLRDCHELVVWGAGQSGRRLTKHLLRRGAKLSFFVDIDRSKVGRKIRGVNVVPPEALDGIVRRSREKVKILAAVSSRGARAKIRAALNALDLREGLDYWCAA